MNITERTTAALGWLDAQLAICDAATKGPWGASYDNDTGEDDDYYYEWQVAGPAQLHGDNAVSDAAFIAAARTGYPAILEGMKAAIKGLQQFAASFDDIPNAAMSALNSLLTTIESLQ